MAAPVGEVEGGSREHEPERALQVLHARAGGEDHLRLDLRESRLRQGVGGLSRAAEPQVIQAERLKRSYYVATRYI